MTTKYRSYTRNGFIVLSFICVFVISYLALHNQTFRDGLKLAAEANKPDVAIAILLIIGTYLAAAFTLQQLAIKPLRFARTTLVQVASGFASKLVPAGIGGFALNTRYLTKQGHSTVHAGSVMAINSLLGFVGHVIILLLALLLTPGSWQDSLAVKVPEWMVLLVIVFILLSGISFLFIPALRRWLQLFVGSQAKLVRAYSKSPLKILGGFLGACMVTVLFAGALNLCALSLGVNLNPLQILLVYSLGALGLAVTPTPGGIGGAEAALTAGFVAVGVEATLALSIALLYRVVSYWLPLAPGFIAFQICLRKKYI